MRQQTSSVNENRNGTFVHGWALLQPGVLFVLLLALVVGVHVAASVIEFTKVSASTRTIWLVLAASVGASSVLLRFTSKTLATWAWPTLIALACLITMPVWLAVIFGIACAIEWPRRMRLLLCFVGIPIVSILSNWVFVYGFNGSTLFAIVQTHPTELLDFVGGNLNLRLSLGLILQLATSIAALRSESSPLAPGIAGFMPMAVSFVILSQVVPNLVPTVRDLTERVDGPQSTVRTPAAGSVIAADVDVVFMLGESTSRWHFPQYGYARPTSPALTARQDQLIWLTDAISTHSHTVESVTSLMLRPSEADESVSESLLGRLHAAQVDTRWYSSQTGIGPWDTPIVQLAREAKTHLAFDNRVPPFLLGVDRFLGLGEGFTADGDMVSALRRDLQTPGHASGPRFWLSHLSATHWDYCRLIPHEAISWTKDWPRGEAFFGNAPDRTRDVNCYDAGILYVDRLISSVVEIAATSSRPVVVVYAPDHGEDPTGGTGHSARLPSSKHVEIPVMFYFNDAARRALPEQWARVKAHHAERFALPWLHETFLDVFGLLKSHDLSSSGLAITSADFDPPLRTLHEGTGPIDYDLIEFNERRDYLLKARMNMKGAQTAPVRPRKILSHRTNTELALLEAKRIFDGVEMDIVFNTASGEFDVYHPPTPSSGLTLKRALEIIADHPHLELWLDWKNADARNISAAVAALDALDARFKLRSRTVVETGTEFVDATARRISAAGYRHTYYLPMSSDLNRSCNQDRNDARCVEAARRSAQAFATVGASCISYDFRARNFALAVKTLASPACELTWDTGLDGAAPDFLSRLPRLKRFDAVLARFPTPFVR